MMGHLLNSSAIYTYDATIQLYKSCADDRIFWVTSCCFSSTWLRPAADHLLHYDKLRLEHSGSWKGRILLSSILGQIHQSGMQAIRPLEVCHLLARKTCLVIIEKNFTWMLPSRGDLSSLTWCTYSLKTDLCCNNYAKESGFLCLNLSTARPTKQGHKLTPVYPLSPLSSTSKGARTQGLSSRKDQRWYAAVPINIPLPFTIPRPTHYVSTRMILTNLLRTCALIWIFRSTYLTILEGAKEERSRFSKHAKITSESFDWKPDLYTK